MPACLTFEEVLREHRAFVRATLWKLGVPAQDLADFEQEVWLGVHERLGRFDPAKSQDPLTALRRWCHGICVRQAATFSRRAKKRTREAPLPQDELDRLPSTEPPTDVRLMDGETLRRLGKMLEPLPAQQRAVMIAYAMHEESIGEVARTLEIPEGTAWSRLRQARRRLRDALVHLASNTKVGGAEIGLRRRGPAR